MYELQDRVALVTGAAGNLGTAVAGALARQGARLALLDIADEALSRMRSTLPPGTEAETVAVDLTDPQASARAVEAMRSRFGRIDILANIAGGFAMGPPLQDTDDATWDRMMDLNLRSVFNTCRAVLPLMLARGSGRIINVSARAGLSPKGAMGPYCASKAGVIALTESLAAENKHYGITVNCILPGTVDTPQNRAAMPEADHDIWVPTDALADVILFLVSDAARCVTGAAIPVYGRS
jgi:NAD(P)-dependent dehydrogenase (short-subunit alcohol dehydrogenase family)